MADYRVTVGASDPADGNDAHTTTIAAAMANIVTNFSYAGSDVATIQLIDAAEYNESNITLGAISGTASVTTYLKIEPTAAVKHDGTYNTSKARVRGTTTGQHVFIVEDKFVHMKNLAIKQDSVGSSDECIRLYKAATESQDVLIEKCVFQTGNVASQDAIYCGNQIVTSAYVFDCVIRMGGANARAAINAQNFDAGSTKTHNWYIEHCTIDCNGSNNTNEGGISAQVGATTATVNMAVNNCAVFDPGANPDCYTEYKPVAGTITWTGDGNISSDTTAETKFGATINFDSVTMRTADSAGEQYLVTDLTGGSEDYQLLKGATGTDVAIAASVSGATQDSRVDLTLDVAGNVRPTSYTARDIGAFQYPIEITSVSGDNVLSPTENPWVISGSGFGTD